MPIELLLGRLAVILLDLLVRYGRGRVALGLLDLQGTFFDEQTQAVHLGIGNALGQLADRVDAPLQLGPGDLERFPGEANADVVLGVAARDIQFEFRPLQRQAGLVVLDSGQQGPGGNELPLGDVQGRQRAGFPRRRVDLFHEADDHVGNLDRFAGQAGGGRQGGHGEGGGCKR